jgi:uncharacterized protein
LKDLLIIDGYNLIFNIFKAGKLSGSRIEEIKSRLIADLAEYSSQKDYEVIAVFDAHGSRNMERSSYDCDDVRVIHSRRGETADSVIEELVSRWSSCRRIVVVTSDYSQQKVIFGKNTTRRSSREFGLEMEAVKRKIGSVLNKNKKKGKAFYPIEKRLDPGTRKKISDYRKK